MFESCQLIPWKKNNSQENVLFQIDSSMEMLRSDDVQTSLIFKFTINNLCSRELQCLCQIFVELYVIVYWKVVLLVNMKWFSFSETNLS